MGEVCAFGQGGQDLRASRSVLYYGIGVRKGCEARPQWVSDVEGNLIDLPGRLLCPGARIFGPLVFHYCENG
jgi:hypothetical protein